MTNLDDIWDEDPKKFHIVAEHCGTCKHLHTEKGHCWRYPPIPIQTRSGSLEMVRPIINEPEKNICGEYVQLESWEIG